jgi:prepilin-type processing-associated H-X9-DG protein
MANAPQTVEDRRTRLLGGAWLVVAVVSVLLGLLSLVLFGNFVASLPALLLGFLSLRAVNQSDGQFRGRAVAAAGMALGGLGTVVGVVALLAVVLVRWREAANQYQCEYNLRQIGIAVNLYHDHQHPAEFPQATIPNAALPADRPDRHLSWLAAILPYLEEAAGPTGTARGTPPHVARARQVNEHLDRTKAWDAEENRQAVATTLPQYRCPSDPARPAPGSAALTDFVGLAGVGADAATLPGGDPRAGFFGYARRLSRADLVPEAAGGEGNREARGTSHILMVAETARDNGPWAQGGPATVRGVDPAQQPYSGPGRPFGGCHPHGLNALFVDGHVMFFRDSFDPEKFEALVLLKTARGEP